MRFCFGFGCVANMAAPMNTCKMTTKIKTIACTSRLFLVVFQVISNVIIPDHDAGVFNPPSSSSQEPKSAFDGVIDLLLGGLRRWDAIYFIHIAEHGYTYENTVAFFPLYPLIIHGLANSLFYPLNFILNYTNVLLVTSICVNIFLFVKSAEMLFVLGRHVLGNDRIAYKACLLFCITPASIFFTAPYSECLYFYLTVTGLFKLEQNSKFVSVIYLGLSFLTRSNGALNICYFLYVVLKATLKQLKNLRKAVTGSVQISLTIFWIFISATVIPYVVLLVISCIPFVGYQVYCYKLYCNGDLKLEIPEYIVQYGKENSLNIHGAGDRSVWCNDSIPMAYSYVQKQYWDQGFLKYWQLKQIPNFLLATPVAVVALSLGVSYYKNNRYICHTLGLDEVGPVKKEQTIQTFQLEGVKLLPYVLHAVALTLFGWFCIHVQVLTRLLFSSCPVLYWYCALLISPDTPQEPRFSKFDLTKPSVSTAETKFSLQSWWKNLLLDQIMDWKKETVTTKLVLLYFLIYYFIGTALFSNFLPWT